MLVFGGCDQNVKDSSVSYIFDAQKKSFVLTEKLRRGHVFVNLPFVHGNYVYAVGNEYYVKHRSIHRFDIEKRTWDIVF